MPSTIPTQVCLLAFSTTDEGKHLNLIPGHKPVPVPAPGWNRTLGRHSGHASHLLKHRRSARLLFDVITMPGQRLNMYHVVATQCGHDRNKPIPGGAFLLWVCPCSSTYLSDANHLFCCIHRIAQECPLPTLFLRIVPLRRSTLGSSPPCLQRADSRPNSTALGDPDPLEPGPQ